jgi:hypothetical protein
MAYAFRLEPELVRRYIEESRAEAEVENAELGASH